MSHTEDALIPGASTLTIVFRGRNTRHIIEDAKSAGLAPGYICCLADENDPMAEDSDLDPSRLGRGVGLISDHKRIIVVANGGPVGPLVKVLMYLKSLADEQDAAANEYAWGRFSAPPRRWGFEVWDVQRDSVRLLAKADPSE